MRFLSAVRQDIRFQYRYGFYLIYVILVVLYIWLISLLPSAWKQNAVAVILFSDPAALGFFFIGGILLLEKGERLLDALFISPLSVTEYIFSKAASLGLISVISGLLIAVLGAGTGIKLPLLTLFLFAGSVFFTLAGICAGVWAKSVNHFMILSIPVELLLDIPPLLLLAGFRLPVLEWMPGSLVLRLLQWCCGLEVPINPVIMLPMLVLWGIPVFFLALWSMRQFLSRIGGGQYEESH